MGVAGAAWNFKHQRAEVNSKTEGRYKTLMSYVIRNGQEKKRMMEGKESRRRREGVKTEMKNRTKQNEENELKEKRKTNETRPALHLVKCVFLSSFSSAILSPPSWRWLTLLFQAAAADALRPLVTNRDTLFISAAPPLVRCAGERLLSMATQLCGHGTIRMKSSLVNMPKYHIVLRRHIVDEL